MVEASSAGCQSITELTRTDRQPITLTFTPAGCLQSTEPVFFVQLLETGAHGGNPHRNKENMQTPRRKNQDLLILFGRTHFIKVSVLYDKEFRVDINMWDLYL